MKTKLLLIIAIFFCSSMAFSQLSFNPTNWSVNDVVTITYTNSGAAGQTQNLYIHQAYDTDNDSSVWEYTDTWGTTGIILTAESGGNTNGIWTGTLDLDNTSMPTAIPNASTIYDFLFLVRDGSNNHWTSDLTVGNGGITGTSLPEMYNSTLSTGNFENNLNIFYANNTLNINGYQGKATIKAYDVFGKLIANKENIQISSSFSTALRLPKNQLSIVVIEADGFKKVLKTLHK